jgi:DNA repair exonuclease SbcCD ATPase subunit
MSFIREGSTRRKEILAKFLDLEIFDEKFKLAKEESASLKGALKRYEGVDYATQLAEYEANLTVSKQEVETRESERSKLVNDKEQLVSSIKKLEEELINLDTASVDIEKAQTDFENSSKIVEDLSSKIEELNNNIRSKTEEVKSIDSSLSEYNLDDLKAKKDEIEKKQKELDKLYQDIVMGKREVDSFTSKIKLLNEVPCGTQFTSCKFIKDAYDAKMKLPLFEDSLDQDKEEHTKLSKEIEEFDVNSVNAQISKYEAIVSKKSRLENEVLKHKLDLNFAKTSKEKNEKIKDQAEELMRLHAVNASNYEAIKEIHTNKKDLKNKLSIVEKSISDIDMDIRKLYIKVGSLEANIENANKLQKEFDQLRNEFAAYEYFMRCTHPNGISYDIIKKKLPIINDEIAKTLANIVDFEVFFEDDGSKLNILIKHPKFDPRPIEMGSGAEKTIASMAIRLALLQVSNLPKSNIFILDEPATALDADNMDGFIRMIDMIKAHYDIVLLISHLDALKDIVDTTITIEKNGSYSYVSV